MSVPAYLPLRTPLGPLTAQQLRFVSANFVDEQNVITIEAYDYNPVSRTLYVLPVYMDLDGCTPERFAALQDAWNVYVEGAVDALI
jgi:hypothetical protein